MKLAALCAVICTACSGPPLPEPLQQRAVELGDRITIPDEHGVIEGNLDGGGSYVIARVGDTVTGVIRDGAAVFEIEPRGERYVLVERSFTRPLHDPGWAAIASEHGVPRPALSNPRVEIDVLFAYTQKVLAGRTLDGIRGLALVAITEANQACKAAGVNVRFRVAGVVPTMGTEVGKDMRHLHYELLNRTDFVDAHAARARLRADILFLLVDKPQGALGLANVMAEPATAVAVVDHRESVVYLTIPHELGHLMGARHDIGDDDRDFPFPYGHGFIGKTSRTIMATPCARPEKCPVVPRWSSPPELGDAATADDARVIRETAATVATFGDRL